VIGQGDPERRAPPLPDKFGQVFGFWLKDQPRGEFVFARAVGQKPVSSQAARAYLRGMLKKAGIDKKISPHQLRHYSACRIMPNGKFALPRNPP
jgi:integrase/recombinase XerD